MKTVTVHHPMGREEVVALLESYRGFNIVKYMDGADCIMVHDPKNETLFVVALDDSKSSGKRKFYEELNTVKEAQAHIDYLCERKADAKLPKADPKDTSFYAELDESTGDFCVFGDHSGHAYASFASMPQAEEEAKRLNDLYSARTNA